ncbi:MAG: hypothetical protein Fur0010_10080 [Bdellovibrio sp.]
MTPSFLRISPNDRDLNFSWGDGGENLKIRAQCHISWGRSVIPNLIPLVLGVPGIIISSTFMITDGLSKGIFDCDEALFAENTRLKITETKDFKKILIIPPFASDLKSSELVLSEFLNSTQYGSEKDTYINFQESQEHFILKGIDYKSTRSFDEIPRNLLETIASHFEATHGLFFFKENQNGRSYVTPQLIDLFTRKIVSSYPQYEVNLKTELNQTWSRIGELFNFIPNAIQGSYYFRSKAKGQFTQSQNSTVNNFKTRDHPDSLPKYLTFLSLDNVEDPSQFRIWDYNLGFYPTLSISAWNLDLNPYVSNYDVSMSTIYALYNLALTGHTPFGALRIHFGMGPGLVDWEDSYGLKQSRIQVVSTIGLTYTAFFNSRWYMRIGQSTYGISKGAGNGDYFKLKDWEEYHLAIGYYFPSLRYLIRNLVGL